MLNVTSPRLRYNQFFVLFVLGSFIYTMAQSAGSGIKNFQDNLYKKDFLMEKAVLLRIKLGDRVFPQVLLGKDGWMDYTSGGNIDDFQNLRTLKNKVELVKRLTTFNQYLQSQDITLMIVVAPNKATIYPDKLPEEIKSQPMASRFDKLLIYLEDNNLPLMLDLRPSLRAARQNQDVYYKTNTHWNGYGAFVAYTTIINALGSSYPELKPYEIADLELKTTKPSAHDIPRLIHANFITEPFFSFELWEPFVSSLHFNDDPVYSQFSSIQDENKLPKLLMYHDSFGSANLNNYLSMNFGESYFIRLKSVPQYLTEETIQQLKPNIVIIEVVERSLDMLLDYLSNFASE